MIQQIIFLVITLLAVGWAIRQFSLIRQTILLGGPYQVSGSTSKRWKNLVLVAFGQQKMFKRVLPALLHLFIYVAFLFTQIELIEILIDGLFGVHRFFADPLGVLYTIIIGTIEVLSLAALIATVVFLVRRNVLKISRFEKPEMASWPKRDANLILLGEILLVTGIFMMNGADTLLQTLDPAHYPDTGTLPISSWLGPLLFGGMETETLIVLERVGWWLHIIVVYAFLNYLPISKHLHIILAFPNTYYANLRSRGEMEAMPEITREIHSMLGIASEDSGDSTASADPNAIPEFGAKDIFDLSWKNLLDAYTCTECGRCTAECPANATGKKLSPRKIMMDIRDRAEEVSTKLLSGNESFKKPDKQNEPLHRDNFQDGLSLFNRISDEELWACTTCNACVEACPVLIDPLEPIMKLRRNKVLMDSAGPSDWNPMFTSLENSGSVWQVTEDREAWTRTD